MKNLYGGSEVLRKKVLGPVTVAQLVAMVVLLIVSPLILSFGGFGSSFIGWLIVAVLAYMVIHVLKADVKTKAAYGVVLGVVCILFGAFVAAPTYVDNIGNETVSDHGAFSSVTYISEEDGTVTASGTLNDGDYSHHTPYLAYADVKMVGFGSVYFDHYDYEKMDVNGTSVTKTISVDPSKLYTLVLVLADENGDGSYDVDRGSSSTATVTSFTGVDTGSICLKGAAYCVMFVLVFYYLILVFSTILRRKIGGERKKMEESGRLYPQGYGRCQKCGAIVLPGEVRCRKCGAYIDRPESMKPKKVDYFQCSACGAEVPADATVCPKCGARFDSVENEVSHTDGTVNVSEETMECPACGKEVPKNADFCPFCGKKF